MSARLLNFIMTDHKIFTMRLLCSSIYIRGGFRGPRGPVPPLQIFFTYNTATINSMKISFNDV